MTRLARGGPRRTGSMPARARSSLPGGSCDGASFVAGRHRAWRIDHHARGARAAHRARGPQRAGPRATASLPPVWVDGGSWAHPLGTDTLGRDVDQPPAATAPGTRCSSRSSRCSSPRPGARRGALPAGFSRGWWDAVLMRMGDMQLAFPFILLAIIVLGVSADRTAWHLILVLGIPGWILYARVVRARVLAERDKDHVTAARSLGAGRCASCGRYVLPSVWQVVLVIALLDLGFVILVESTLSFLGLRAAAADPSWGSILAEGRKNMLSRAVARGHPRARDLITVLAVNLMADGAADVLDPTAQEGRASRRAPPAPGPFELRRPTSSRRRLPSTTRCGRRRWPPILRCRGPAGRVPLRRPGPAGRARRRRFASGADETLGIVGESGSGKSVTALVDHPAARRAGAGHGRPDPVRGRGPHPDRRPRDGGAARHEDRHDLPEPGLLAQPGHHVGSQMVETIRQPRVHGERPTRPRRWPAGAHRRRASATPTGSWAATRSSSAAA